MGALCPKNNALILSKSEELYLEERRIKNNSEGGSQKGVRKTFYADEKRRFIKDRNHKTGYKLGDLLKYLVCDTF